MNQPLFLHIVERLEGFLAKLPASIQKPILQELTPLKELFLKQRSPRFVLTGSIKLAVPEIVSGLFPQAAPDVLRGNLTELFHWQEISIGDHGTIALLDARGADEAGPHLQEELKRQPADIFFFFADGDNARGIRARDLDSLTTLIGWNDAGAGGAKVVGISVHGAAKSTKSDNEGKLPKVDRAKARLRLQNALVEKVGDRCLEVVELSPGAAGKGSVPPATQALMSILGRYLPNEARVEMIRISRDREAQQQIAQVLVKSTTAICTAIGAQPIPLADLPILTTLQLVMVSGIMHLGGRERSLRAATEFVTALGVNVGAGMVLREGTRALLKFFPGWGNVLCGMVAGAGTYAIGRAAIVYFLEGVSLKDARRTYLRSRKKPARPPKGEKGRSPALRERN